MIASALALAVLQTPLAFEPELAPNSGLAQPVGLTSIPGDERVFVTELIGRVSILRDQAIDPAPFLDVSHVVEASALSGLRAFTFDPDYAANGRVYLWYDVAAPGAAIDLALARMERDALDPDRVDPASFVELLRFRQDNRGHGGGHLQFGPDGMLWAAAGDGAAPGASNCRARDRSNLMGSVLRIDVTSAFPYAIPPDNPFVNDSGSRGEIAHFGLRHPWKWSFDRLTGDMWIADVGELEREEVHFIRQGTLGLDLGWSVHEGTTCFTSSVCTPGQPPCGDASYTMPVWEYDHTQGCSITGGFVYRGSEIPSLYGAYVCTDFCSRRFWTLRYDGVALTEAVERPLELRAGAALPPTPVAFGEDGDGEILLLDHATGAILRLVEPCGARTICAGEPNGTGQSANLRALGTPSLSTNAFGFRVSGLPTFAGASLFYGPEAASTPLGNGTLCIGGSGLFRVDTQVSNAEGIVEYALDFTTFPLSIGPGKIEVGESWFFQVWYRDVGGSNLSSAARVLFCD